MSFQGRDPVVVKGCSIAVILYIISMVLLMIPEEVIAEDPPHDDDGLPPQVEMWFAPPPRTCPLFEFPRPLAAVCQRTSVAGVPFLICVERDGTTHHFIIGAPT